MEGADMGLIYNVRRMAAIFCAAIAIVTVSVLAMRLTVFSDSELAPPLPSASAAEPIEPGEIEGSSDFPYKLNSRVFFPDAVSAGNVLIQNPETNKYLLSVDIVLPETRISLYYSGAIAPGEQIESAVMSAAGQKLMDGTYECTADISARDPETYQVVANEKKPVTIQIGK
jgi:hypothetical protein